ncbi:O-antigen ligase family protein [Alcaligenaceae bacterium CGII-47]|nr:O-antigen ligase family protein [Alcaligenaceae bacterium CGII-47]
MMLSGLLNRDAVTLYQVSKITVIGGLFIVMWWLVLHTESHQLTDAMHWMIPIAVLSFFIFRIIPSTAYTAGGIREGYILAMPGEVWKAGAYFLPVLLADLIVRPRRWVLDSLAIAACIFLVLVDRSRTGLLLMFGIVACLGALLWWRSEWHLLIRRPRWILLVAVCLISLLFLDSRVNISSGVIAAESKGQVADVVENAVGDALAPLVGNRLGAGDVPRTTMLHNGIATAKACFPMGCGFGSTAMDPGYGIQMDVHNAYLGVLADFGVIGLLGMLGFIAAALLPMKILWDPDARPERVYFVLGVAGSALAYCATFMLHTFSSEMSEWGYLILMLAFAWAPQRAQSSVLDANRVNR